MTSEMFVRLATMVAVEPKNGIITIKRAGRDYRNFAYSRWSYLRLRTLIGRKPDMFAVHGCVWHLSKTFIPWQDCRHRWVDEYYGVRCRNCDTFYAHGTEPWLPVDDYEEEWDGEGYLGESDFDDDLDLAAGECSMLDDGTCLQAGSEYCDFDCPFRDMEIEEIE